MLVDVRNSAELGCDFFYLFIFLPNLHIFDQVFTIVSLQDLRTMTMCDRSPTQTLMQSSSALISADQTPWTVY